MFDTGLCDSSQAVGALAVLRIKVREKKPGVEVFVE